MDESIDGVIYVDLATNLIDENIQEGILQQIIEAFGQIKQTVIWKYDEILVNIPKNLYTIKKPPQQSILSKTFDKIIFKQYVCLFFNFTIHINVFNFNCRISCRFFSTNTPIRVTIINLLKNRHNFNFEKRRYKIAFETYLNKKIDFLTVSNYLFLSDHVNTIAFINHGDMLSIIEAAYHGVPVIGIPITEDQISNIDVLAQREYGIKVDFNKELSSKVVDAIDTIVEDKRFVKI